MLAAAGFPVVALARR